MTVVASGLARLTGALYTPAMKPILFAVLAGLCWGVGELCTKSVLHTRQVGPFALLMVRVSVALPPAILAYLLAAHRFTSEPAAFLRADAGTLAKLFIGSAFLAGFAGVLFFYLSLVHGQISTVKPIAFTIAPAIAVLGGWVLLGEEMTPRKAVAIALMLAGIVLLTADFSFLTRAKAS